MVRSSQAYIRSSCPQSLWNLLRRSVGPIITILSLRSVSQSLSYVSRASQDFVNHKRSYIDIAFHNLLIIFYDNLEAHTLSTNPLSTSNIGDFEIDYFQWITTFKCCWSIETNILYFWLETHLYDGVGSQVWPIWKKELQCLDFEIVRSNSKLP